MGGEEAAIVAGADPFGAALKDHLVEYLRGKGIAVEDRGVGDKYYQVGEEIGQRVAENKAAALKGLIVCGTGIGVSVFANKSRGIYATPCSSVADAQNARSINNSNVITLGAVATPPAEAEKIVDAWLATPFKSPCPANQGNPWPEEIHTFLDKSLPEMEAIGGAASAKNPNSSGAAGSDCAICELASARSFDPVDIMPGGSWKILRQEPTSAVVRFKAGSLEPAHHHTFGHDVIVLEGRKRVWNVTKGEVFDLATGDFLYTPAGDVHRVQYVTDTEFFIRWDGLWDILLDEDLAAASAAVKKDN
ncbi:hypothetical protein SELMODRAFT_234225 [Selaginella moellendorffii]|uniref:Cupin type-2 domain-containing protein n=1 Tax=Selaginella moellendorffii TaxID=88036 RepID=D8SJ15_SELML|nr:DNA damage-repair/toleration protein DRT102 [Selaginella moellendorffii]EFJ15721.1 hypothetical protein SELMODRAFT_234225 [Selaginella moellendorffii]|eukprot:XP_002983379.1 DNA damage-repair/toleration protein DRT102 [Selaginella moellendorffii]